ncbi:MAG TPA: penicillin-binding protein 2 [Actinomycetes bacterium]|nr:penicillin-binding protein 2 [Actinomycetes bacterium]
MAARRARQRSASRRLLALLVCSMVGFTVISARLVALQVVDSSNLAAAAAGQRLRKVELPAGRGRIFDRNGRDLALSVDARTVYAQPPLVADPRRTAARLAPLLKIGRGELAAKLGGDAPFVYLARKVRPVVGARVARLRLAGVGVLDDSRRTYPDGRLAAQVLGFVGTDGDGLAGLELHYESLLQGRAGWTLLEQDPRGRPIPRGRRHVQPPVPGSDVVTTLDAPLQFKAEDALARAVRRHHAHGGSIVVLSPTGGEVLAMANLPAFDPNGFARSKPAQRRNRAVVDAFEPGSTNKTITAAAALEAGVVTPRTRLRVPDQLRLCPNKTFHDAHRHGLETIPFSRVVAESSNVGTIRVAQRLGARRLAAAAAAFGYGRPTGIDFPGESPGLVTPVERWRCTDLGVNAIGQGVAVTVLQMASVYATVANGGVLVEPSLVRGVVDPWGRYRDLPPTPARRVVSEKTARDLTRILTGVVKEGGTGTEAAIGGYQVAGKTGTARVPDTRKGGYIPGAYIASFIGFAPADRARDGVVVAVVLDRPTPIYGGLVAAPTFREVASFAMQRLGLAPRGHRRPAGEGGGR